MISMKNELFCQSKLVKINQNEEKSINVSKIWRFRIRRRVKIGEIWRRKTAEAKEKQMLNTKQKRKRRNKERKREKESQRTKTDEKSI